MNPKRKEIRVPSLQFGDVKYDFSGASVPAIVGSLKTVKNGRIVAELAKKETRAPEVA